MPCSPWKRVSPTAIGIVLSVLETISGHSRLFQWNMKAKTARVASAGPDSGRMIRQKHPQRLAPSIRAASSSSNGMPRKNWRSRKTPKAVKACGMISPA